MNVFTTYALRWTLGDLNINMIHINRYQVLLNWFQPYPTPMLKNADYVGKTTDIFVPVCCKYILSKYLMGLNNRKFLFRTICWSSYEDDGYGWNQFSNTWYRFMCIMFIFKSPKVHRRAYVVNTFMFQLVWSLERKFKCVLMAFFMMG
jgi:hypothetical protein